MIRLTLLLLLAILGYMLYRVNADTVTTFHFLDHTTREMPLALLLLYSFLAGWAVHAAFTLPGRIAAAFKLFMMRRGKRLMGEDLADVIEAANKK
jgi:uncharacterized integral membrane protein